MAVSPSAEETKTEKAVLFKNEMDKVSYVIGSQLGRNFKMQGIEINIEPLMLGIKDAMAGKELALSQDEMQQAMTSFQQRMTAKQASQGAENLAAGNAFLEANKAKAGVKVLPAPTITSAEPSPSTSAMAALPSIAIDPESNSHRSVPVPS